MEGKINLANIDAVIFDLGGVILNIDYQKTIQAFESLNCPNFSALYTQQKQTGLFDAFETGQISATEFINAIQNEWPHLSQQQIISAWNAMLLDLPKRRLDFLLQIKQHKKTFCYSNINALHAQSVSNIIRDTIQMENLNHYFDKVYYSHLIQLRKPNHAGFTYILDEQQLNANRTLFVDDSIQHINAAKQLGLQTFFLAPGMEIDKDIF